MTGETFWVTDNSREGWSVRTESRCRLTCTADDFRIFAEVVAFEGEGEVEIERKTWEEVIPRDFM